MQPELTADDGVRGEDEQAATRVDVGHVRIAGVCRADELRPLLAHAVFRGPGADVVFDQQLLNQVFQLARRPALHACRLLQRDAAEVADELLGEFAEGLGAVRHGERVR